MLRALPILLTAALSLAAAGTRPALSSLPHPATRDKGPDPFLFLKQVDRNPAHWRPGPAHPLTRDRGPGAVLEPVGLDHARHRGLDHPATRDKGPAAIWRHMATYGG